MAPRAHGLCRLDFGPPLECLRGTIRLPSRQPVSLLEWAYMGRHRARRAGCEQTRNVRQGAVPSGSGGAKTRLQRMVGTVMRERLARPRPNMGTRGALAALRKLLARWRTSIRLVVISDSSASDRPRPTAAIRRSRTGELLGTTPRDRHSGPGSGNRGSRRPRFVAICSRDTRSYVAVWTSRSGPTALFAGAGATPEAVRGSVAVRRRRGPRSRY